MPPVLQLTLGYRPNTPMVQFGRRMLSVCGPDWLAHPTTLISSIDSRSHLHRMRQVLLNMRGRFGEALRPEPHQGKTLAAFLGENPIHQLMIFGRVPGEDG